MKKYSVFFGLLLVSSSIFGGRIQLVDQSTREKTIFWLEKDNVRTIFAELTLYLDGLEPALDIDTRAHVAQRNEALARLYETCHAQRTFLEDIERTREVFSLSQKVPYLGTRDVEGRLSEMLSSLADACSGNPWLMAFYERCACKNITLVEIVDVLACSIVYFPKTRMYQEFYPVDQPHSPVFESGRGANNWA